MHTECTALLLQNGNLFTGTIPSSWGRSSPTCNLWITGVSGLCGESPRVLGSGANLTHQVQSAARLPRSKAQVFQHMTGETWLVTYLEQACPGRTKTRWR